MELQNEKAMLLTQSLENLVAEQEAAARHLFVVCGEPSTQEGFEAAWEKEDSFWFDQWCHLKEFIRRCNRELV